MTAADFYPMPSFPTLGVGDLAASVACYETLGFATVFVMPGPGGAPGLTHLRWARYADLMLAPAHQEARQEARQEEGRRGLGVTLTFAVADGVDALDALAERARAAGATILREPGNRPWNARDFSVADPDGYALVFTYGPIDRALTIGQVAENVRGG
ncbi:MAG TPA: VOC family protein [Rhizomicrobium sp.]|nr:VOC family protein [Rhizomicrobium sp.]